LIEVEKTSYPIGRMCSVLRVGRSTFYDWRFRVNTVTAMAARRAKLAIQVAKGLVDV
jgi:hypothetical protein